MNGTCELSEEGALMNVINVIKVLSIATVLLFHGMAFGQSNELENILADPGKNAHSKGSEKAPVTLIEFSDFQCSFCRRFWKTTLPLIERRYIETGRLRFVYRHFAILGKHSVAAAEATECAGEQRKFWTYHDKLFTRATKPFAYTDGKLKRYAKELGLDEQSFVKCLDTGRYSKKVEEDTIAGAVLGARGTPTFFLNGTLLVGAQPFKVFEPAIEKAIREASRVEKGRH
jgi:protein-disulfide isomerase